ncbi:MAG: aldehyde dehydrogenase family protein [Patescibacteria group bacterium]
MGALSVRESYDLLEAVLDGTARRPALSNHMLVNGKVRELHGTHHPLVSPVPQLESGKLPEQEGLPVIADIVHATGDNARQCVRAADEAFRNREWADASWGERAACLADFRDQMAVKRELLVRLLMLEIAKTRKDAEAEVDRTLEYIDLTVGVMHEQAGKEQILYERTPGKLYERRSVRPKGVTVVLAPSNYPLNETFTTLISALAVGNTVVAKAAKQGVLTLMALLPDFAECFPPGVVNVFSGDHDTVEAMAQTGDIAIFSFFGATNSGNKIRRKFAVEGPTQMELAMGAKNILYVRADADIALAVKVAVDGAFSYNGQRCTAVKHVIVHAAVAEEFQKQYVLAVDALKSGRPEEPGVRVTPLLNPQAVQHQQNFVRDAVSQGASVANNPQLRPDLGLAYYPPTVLTGVTRDMNIYHEEQFGTVIPVTVVQDDAEAIEVYAESQFGQQASIVTQANPLDVDFSRLTRSIGAYVQQVLINMPPARGPEGKPFGAAHPNSAVGQNQDFRSNLPHVFGREHFEEIPVASLTPEQRASAVAL